MFRCDQCRARYVLTTFEAANDLRRPYCCPYCGSAAITELQPADAHKLRRKVAGFKRGRR